MEHTADGDKMLEATRGLSIEPADSQINEQQILDLTRLMNCLVSSQAKQDLYGRFDDEELVDFMNGLTEELADVGVDWWNSNYDYLDTVIEHFHESINWSAKDLGLDVSKLLVKFGRTSWSDLIRETFYFASELQSGYSSMSELDDFLTYAVKRSIEYSWQDLEDLTSKDWTDIELTFERWWNDEVPQKLFFKVFTATQPGQNLVNDKF